MFYFVSRSQYTNISSMNSAGQCFLLNVSTNLIFFQAGTGRHTDGRDQRTNSKVILQEPVNFILETESVSHWLGTHQSGQSDPPVVGWILLPLPPQHHKGISHPVWLFHGFCGLNSGCHGCAASTLPTEHSRGPSLPPSSQPRETDGEMMHRVTMNLCCQHISLCPAPTPIADTSKSLSEPLISNKVTFAISFPSCLPFTFLLPFREQRRCWH